MGGKGEGWITEYVFNLLQTVEMQRLFELIIFVYFLLAHKVQELH